ncbi:MAG: hypothetical protein OHK0022_52360 [Roseiflexaceae bacterium]
MQADQAIGAPQAHRNGWVQQVFVGLAWLLAGTMLAQVFLAGMNVFTQPRWWGLHIQLGHAIGGGLMLLALVAWLGRLPTRLRWCALLALGLFALQYNHRTIAGLFHLPALAALHAANALVLFWLTTSLARWGGRSGFFADHSGLERSKT